MESFKHNYNYNQVVSIESASRITCDKARMNLDSFTVHMYEHVRVKVGKAIAP